MRENWIKLIKTNLDSLLHLLKTQNSRACTTSMLLKREREEHQFFLKDGEEHKAIKVGLIYIIS